MFDYVVLMLMLHQNIENNVEIFGETGLLTKRLPTDTIASTIKEPVSSECVAPSVGSPHTAVLCY